jgi:uncharacterized repeat protein (TIGR03803 family)
MPRLAKTFTRTSQIVLLFITAAATVVLVSFAPQARAQNFQVLHTFEGSDGAVPNALAIDPNGNLFGVTYVGGTNVCFDDNGPNGCGTVFELTNKNSQWTFTTQYQFQNPVWAPGGPVTIGAQGILYGVTANHVTSDRTGGSVFALRPVCADPQCNQTYWKESTLHNFGGCNGNEPFGGLALDSLGNLYGTTYYGCPFQAWGVAYQLSPAQSLDGTWQYTVLHQFQGPPDGSEVSGPVILDPAGNLYGMTDLGGPPPSQYGIVYELSPAGNSWTENILHSFSGPDGYNPLGNLVRDASGNLFGGTSGCRGICDIHGTVFELSPSENGWSFQQIYVFNHPGQNGTPSGLTMDSAGNLYGTLDYGGAYLQGNVFKLAPTANGWQYTDLYDFTGGGDGATPYGPLVLDANGNLYGTAYSGGDLDCDPRYPEGCGTVWMISQSDKTNSGPYRK